MSDNFRRGSHGGDQDAEDGESWPGCGGRETPPAGRDQSVMFWESIGMKPGDDWQVRAETPKGRGGRGSDEAQGD